MIQKIEKSYLVSFNELQLLLGLKEEIISVTPKLNISETGVYGEDMGVEIKVDEPRPEEMIGSSHKDGGIEFKEDAFDED